MWIYRSDRAILVLTENNLQSTTYISYYMYILGSHASLYHLEVTDGKGLFTHCFGETKNC